ncbi:calnexin isoform X1 [Electrophorus electricus]|uniref:calnexin isoform X1 n=1 Tax=Electrophorus electricus TaxID=8005 RepID=UPI0015D0A11A|nr:calnexin isoform X1 [Electrophorus electricus]
MISRQGMLVGLCFYLTWTATNEDQSIYRDINGPSKAYITETFDTSPLDRNWVLSQALKERELDIHKYDGEWVVEEPSNQEFPGNKGLILKSPGRHHAIATYIHPVFHFNSKPLCLQYEVFFQKGIDCGGAYIKLLSHSDDLRLSQFNDVTPYTIMFGPDKCGNTYKVHFIFRHWNPVTGLYEEKHAQQPEADLSEYFIDHKPHLYTLNLYPDNTFEILIDQVLVNQGSLLMDMDPPVVPPCEIEDPEDTKPTNWDDRNHIPDPAVMKPQDWDEEAPQFIADPKAQRPLAWIEEEEPFIPHPEAHPPIDWSVDMDGEWEAPLIANPACSEAPGCGPWKPPMVSNPAYKGKWKAPMIDNPNYQGKWKPQMVPNPAYFEDPQPFKMSPVGAVGFELWSLTGNVLFDNILLCDDLELAKRWTEDTWGQRQTPGIVKRLLSATIKHPWLWSVYVFTVGLPIILFVSFMWPDKRFGPPDQDYYYKKSDEPQPDSPQDTESNSCLSDCGANARTGSRKRDTNKPQKNQTWN